MFEDKDLLSIQEVRSKVEKAYAAWQNTGNCKDVWEALISGADGNLANHKGYERGMDRIRPRLGHCEIKLGTSVFCEPTEPASQ